MITTPKEYMEKLWLAQTENFPRKAILPYAEKIYEIDLKTRKIDSPKFLSVLKDHSAESVYFSVPRYVDYMDLAETACVIQYKRADGKVGMYHVPYYDITSQNDPGRERLIFPWLLSGYVTEISGNIEYSIKFFRINEAGTKYLYNLNTLPATSAILYGLDVQSEDFGNELLITPSAHEDLLDKISQLQNRDIYWISMK